MKKVQKINHYFKLIIKGVMIYELVFAVLVKMHIELSSHLKRQRCEKCKENTFMFNILNINIFLIYYQGVRTNKTVKILDMSLRLKKACPVY